jgi:hypothetical protein
MYVLCVVHGKLLIVRVFLCVVRGKLVVIRVCFIHVLPITYHILHIKHTLITNNLHEIHIKHTRITNNLPCTTHKTYTYYQ